MDGQQIRETLFEMVTTLDQPFEPPEWRSQWVERTPGA
jgi:hypothetical protein